MAGNERGISDAKVTVLRSPEEVVVGRNIRRIKLSFSDRQRRMAYSGCLRRALTSRPQPATPLSFDGRTQNADRFPTPIGYRPR